MFSGFQDFPQNRLFSMLSTFSKYNLHFYNVNFDSFKENMISMYIISEFSTHTIRSGILLNLCLESSKILENVVVDMEFLSLTACYLFEKLNIEGKVFDM